MPRSDGPLVVCVINLKGGVGKSTITALLARHAYSRRKKDVLAIDIDPQANLSQALMRSQYNTGQCQVLRAFQPTSSFSRKVDNSIDKSIHRWVSSFMRS